MNIEEVINNLKKYISFSEKECNFPSIWDWNWHMDLANDIKTLLTAYEKEKKKNKKIKIIVNKLMPLAECSYWNYENHTCIHTCRGCDDLNEYNKRTASGIIIDKDRYCRLYEDGHIQEDTKFVSVEDLINRHLKEE